MRMQWDIDRNASVECNRGEILIKKGFEEDDLVPMFQECHENRVLA